MAKSGSPLLGRRTYEDLYGFWPSQTGSPFTEVLNHAPKYVTSRMLREPLSWSTSILLGGEAADAAPVWREAPRPRSGPRPWAGSRCRGCHA